MILFSRFIQVVGIIWICLAIWLSNTAHVNISTKYVRISDELVSIDTNTKVAKRYKTYYDGRLPSRTIGPIDLKGTDASYLLSNVTSNYYLKVCHEIDKTNGDIVVCTSMPISEIQFNSAWESNEVKILL